MRKRVRAGSNQEQIRKETMKTLPESAAGFLLEVIEKFDLLAVECFVCNRPIKDHTDEEVRTCLEKP